MKYQKYNFVKFREQFNSNHEGGNRTCVVHQMSVQPGNGTNQRKTTNTSPDRVRSQGEGDKKSWVTNR